MNPFQLIRAKCYAKKLQGAGKIGYSVYENAKGERFVKMDGNFVGMPSPGTFSPLYFKVNDHQFGSLDKPFPVGLNGYSESPLEYKFCNNDTTPGFLRAVLKDYAAEEETLAKVR